MPKLGDPKKNTHGRQAIAPPGQLIELRQSNDPRVWLAQYAPQPKFRRYPINSSDNISSNLHVLLDRRLIDSRIRLRDIARFDESHIAWSYGPPPVENIGCLTGLP
jgi:hypothetical protein